VSGFERVNLAPAGGGGGNGGEDDREGRKPVVSPEKQFVEKSYELSQGHSITIGLGEGCLLEMTPRSDEDGQRVDARVIKVLASVTDVDPSKALVDLLDEVGG
jgi:hypothetical protein